MEHRERVARVNWYHTIDLGNGVVTAGWFDTRASAHKVPLPARLDGKRCLDVGTWDGFWAFEMERRGAASVTAIDIFDQDRWDWPPRSRLSRTAEEDARLAEEFREQGAGFRLAHELLGSSVERIDLSVYELSPEHVGTFEVVFLGTLLMHLRDPVAALSALRGVCTGEAVIADAVDAIPSVLRPRTPSARLEGLDRPWWWVPNRAGLHRMVRAAGFEIAEATGLYVLPRGKGHPREPLRSIPALLRTPLGRDKLAAGLRGQWHAAVRAVPATSA